MRFRFQNGGSKVFVAVHTVSSSHSTTSKQKQNIKGLYSREQRIVWCVWSVLCNIVIARRINKERKKERKICGLLEIEYSNHMCLWYQKVLKDLPFFLSLDVLRLIWVIFHTFSYIKSGSTSIVRWCRCYYIIIIVTLTIYYIIFIIIYLSIIDTLTITIIVYFSNLSNFRYTNIIGNSCNSCWLLRNSLGTYCKNCYTDFKIFIWFI